MTLQRAKGMLEQSHVPIAGVVVNSLNEDIQNWSSYGYDGAPPASPALPLRRCGGERRTRRWPWPARRTLDIRTALPRAARGPELGVRTRGQDRSARASHRDARPELDSIGAEPL